jgi:UDP-glucuronate decarboxylase
MARVLVTGGAGFVGSHLCERLLQEGHEVFSLDSFQTGSEANIAHLAGPAFHSIRHDVEAPYELINIDQIYHLACPASPVHYQADPIRTMRTSVLGTLNMLELAQRNSARFVLASTSEVYGDPEVHPQIESYRGCVNPIGIRACYDEGKRAAETLTMDYHRVRGVNVGIARIFNTYGPRMAFEDGRVVSNFLIQAMRNEALTVYGDGSQTRSFCYVSDLVAGLVALMNKPGFTGPVNLGNETEFTILELAEKVTARYGGAGIVRHPLPSDDPTRRKPDTSLARQVLGWAPTVPLDQGLEWTGADFQTRLRT